MEKDVLRFCEINSRKGFLDYLACQSHSSVLLFSSFLVIVTGIVDHIASNDIAFAPLYIIPIAIYAWNTENKKHLILFAVVTAIISSDILLYKITNNPPQWFMYLWNLFISSLLYIPASFLIRKLKEAYFREKNLARIDYLTDIANWKAFSEILQLERERSKRYNQPISIIYIDCDNFKRLNDTFGHGKGDIALKIIGETLRINIRKIDLVARLGGDEFAIILTNAGKEDALTVTNKLNALLIKEMQANNMQITFSIGIASFNNMPETIEEMVNQADNLMYQVKNSSKNDIKQGVY